MLIGGTAATLAMEDAGLDFRATKDLDIVLHIAALNAAFGTSYATDDEMLGFMTGNKTEWALRVFETSAPITFPKYVLDAVQ